MLTYDYECAVTIGDTNAMGNVYFANYFKLQGIVRELWMRDSVPNLDTHLKTLYLSTKSAHCDYKSPFFLYDQLLIKLYFTNLKHVSVQFNFDFYHKKDGALTLHAKGDQVIVFQDLNKKPCRIPQDYIEAFRKLLVAESLDRKVHCTIQ